MGKPTNETQCHHWLLGPLIYFQLVSIPSESPASSSSAPCVLQPLMPILTEGLMTLHLTFCTDFLTDYTPFRTNVLSWSQGVYPITKVFAKFLELSLGALRTCPGLPSIHFLPPCLVLRLRPQNTESLLLAGFCRDVSPFGIVLFSDKNLLIAIKLEEGGFPSRGRWWSENLGQQTFLFLLTLCGLKKSHVTLH